MHILSVATGIWYSNLEAISLYTLLFTQAVLYWNLILVIN